MGLRTTVAGLEQWAILRDVSLDLPKPGVLKACPFCGHPAAFADNSKRYQGHDKYVIAVSCSNTSCGVVTPGHYTTRETAAEAWNRRV